LTTENLKIDRGISDIVGVFTDPILVYPGGWGDTLPDWLKQAITMERLIENMKALKGEPMTGTDAEACAYLYTASLTAPMDRDWSEIYLYVAGKVYEKHRTKESGVTMPGDIRVDHLSDYQMQHLNRLKDWIYRQRVKVRQERNRTDRRERKEEDAAKRETEQPALFDL
jgi:hypothetical protein